MPIDRVEVEHLFKISSLSIFAMTTLVHISINLSVLNTNISSPSHEALKKIQRCSPLKFPHSCWFHENELRVGASLLGKEGILVKETKKKRVVLVRLNKGSGFNGGGGDGREDGNTGRIVGNLALAIGLTYLSMTGQLGWVLDAIVSVWLLVVILPIVGLGAFFWWAGRDIVQSSCPNCGNEFQIFKSALNGDLQLCPYCSQPFSVVDDKFVSDSVKFSNQSTTFGEAFNDFSPRSTKAKNTSRAVVDVEAEVKDAD